MTKVVLLDRVAGQYHFVAQGEALTTTEHPWGDVSAGVMHAVEKISEVTGRQFFDARGDLISPETEGRDGVDIFAATASASQPLQVVIGGLVRDLSVASVERAAAGTYALIKAILAADSHGISSEEQRVLKIRDATPDVICIAGGTEGGAQTPVLELVEASALACSLMEPEERPLLLYAGNSQLRKRVAKLVDGRVELRVCDNVRPTVDDESLFCVQEELDAVYMARKLSDMPGAALLSRWSPVPLTPTARAFGRLIHYLWHLGAEDRGVIGVDVGAANTTLAAAFDGQLYLTVRSDIGNAFGGEEMLLTCGAEAFARWLPEPVSEAVMRGMFVQRATRPAAIPQTPQELWVEHALTREAIRSALAIGRPGWEPGAAQPYPHLLPLCDTIVVSGGVLAHAPRPGQAALIVLDALEPIGVSTLVLDVHGLSSALGGVAAIKPLAAVEALDSGGFVNLATVVTPVGPARPGDTVLKVKVTYDDESALDVEVHHGDLEVLPLLPEQEAVLELQPARHIDVGLGGPGKAGKRRVSGGLVGLIIDARGRPLTLAAEPEERHQQIRQWLWDVGG
jgi:hypothetical protein